MVDESIQYFTLEEANKTLPYVRPVASDIVDAYLEELSNVGCVFKGFDDGLVDFHSRIEGRDVFLCWRLGEEEITHWHELDAGFAGRQELVPELVQGGSE